MSLVTGRIEEVELSKRALFFENKIEREWLSTEEAAHYLSVSENALRIMVYRGQILAHKFGRRLRFRLKNCRALINPKGA
jgi:excisionase family DNA binding protein